MTYPRSHTVAPDRNGIYHCISRCVRRAWLCGKDQQTGRSFEHRKSWIEDRLLELSGIFAVQLWGYAVMSNHYHAVIEVRPMQARQWRDDEVAERWLRLCKVSDAAAHERRLAAIVANAERVSELRQRLASLSWFMRYMNEPLARRANQEDGCTGRFWQGRFHSEALLDERATLAAMTYVDLNPVRAGIVDTPALAEHTGLAHRLRPGTSQGTCLGPLDQLGLTLPEYVALVQWSVDSDPPGESRPTSFGTQLLTPDDWRRRINALRRHWRAHGAIPVLRKFADECGQRWFQGVATAPTH